MESIYKYGICLSFGMVLMARTTYGACTSAPSCLSLGYTKTAISCPNGGVKCPFDTSKWFCNKSCEEFGFNYNCTGTGYSSGAGTACEGKYASCNCANGYSWKNGNCVQNMPPSSPSGNCCDDVGVGCGVHSTQSCKSAYNLPICPAMTYACNSIGGRPRFVSCLRNSAATDHPNYSIYACD